MKIAFEAGYEAGVEDAGSGKLLAETLDLRYALFSLDDKTKRANALDELAITLSGEPFKPCIACVKYGQF